MSLTTATNIARQSLIASQYQIALSARNVAAAGDPERSRVSLALETTVDGGVRGAAVRRAEDEAVYARMIKATAATAERDVYVTHLDVLSQTVGDPQNSSSIGAMIGELQTALADYANAPDDPNFGRAVIERGRDVATKLNDTTTDLLLMRERADQDIAEAVEEINNLLESLHEINGIIVRGTASERDISMDLDRRDSIVAQISEHLGVTTLVRENNDIALFTDGGVTLYDNGARSVNFQRTAVYTTGTVGGNIYVDGVEIVGEDSPMPSVGGSIVGNAKIRDEIVPTYQLQMDEIAREITDIFADGVGSLFTNDGVDYAGTIAIAADVDPTQGGSVENLRDGTGNAAGYASYSDRLFALGDALSTNTAFDANAELSDQASLLDFISESAGWLEENRSTATAQLEEEAAILVQASNSLSAATGVNLDDEYAQQLAIEQSFNASSRLILVIDEMFNTLLGIT